MPCITLLSDFGSRDWFAGTMKGVIAGIAPQSRVIDITHEIPAGDIRAGAFALAASCRFFPQGTVHVVVVDPGVGSRRRAIAVQAAGSFFVGPDNGVLSFALAKQKVTAVRMLKDRRYLLQPISHTFHGRDVFAPAGAHLSRGVPITKLGPSLQDYERLPWPEPRREKNRWMGEVVYIDRFGNAITNLENRFLESLGGTLQVFGGRRRLCPVGGFYGAVPKGRPVALPGSSGFLEIAVNDGSAALKFHLKIGQGVTLRSV